MTTRLQQIDRRLVAGVNFKLKPHELVISADDDVAAFPVVKDLVATAPAIPGWKGDRVHQRKTGELHIAMGGTTLGPDDIWFRGRVRGGKLEAALYLRGLTDGNRSLLHQMALILLQGALGEYDFGTKVAVPSVDPLLRPSRELVAAVDALK